MSSQQREDYYDYDGPSSIDSNRPLGRPDRDDYNYREEDFEENHEAEPYDMELSDWLLLVSRCLVVLIFVVSYLFVFINVARGHRLKNWRLYVLVALVLFCWLVLSLYQDHIDVYFVQEIHRWE